MLTFAFGYTNGKKGKSHQDKLSDLKKYIDEKNAYGLIVSALDEVAWLYNLRGSDVECNPVFYAYSIVTLDDAILYVEDSKVTDEVRQHLGDHVILKPYAAVFDDLQALSSKLQSSGKKLLTNSKTSLAVEVAVGEVIMARE